MKQKNRWRLLFLPVCLVLTNKVRCQPYIDIAGARYVTSPAKSTGQDAKNNSPLNYANISLTIPFQFHQKQDAVILSPFAERWETNTDTASVFSKYHYGLVLPVSLLLSSTQSKWSLLSTAIIRINNATIGAGSYWQLGGALIAGYKKSSSLTYKFGMYVNGEFFGLFVIPLLGIDWQISDRDNLFGVLPASLSFEHRLNPHLYWGAVFRTFTNSYHDSATNYFRVDENQVGVFMDAYIGKHIVLNLEAGHSILRKVRTGTHFEIKNNWNIPDNFYFKCMVAYRLRFR